MPLDPNILEVQRLQNVASAMGWQLLNYTMLDDAIQVTLIKKKQEAKTVPAQAEMMGRPESVRVGT